MTTTTATLATATPNDVLRLVLVQAEADDNAAVLGKIERGRASPEDRARASGMAERALGAERLRRAGETGELPPRSVVGNYPRREQVERWPFAGDLDWNEAVSAFSGTSHVPERRAAGVFWDYADHMQKMRTLLGDDFEAYRAGYTPRFRAWLRSRANVASTMITGGSGFNVRRAEKRSATADNRWNDVDQYHTAFLKRRAREQVAARRATGGGPVAELRAELERLERLQVAMKAVNAEIRKLKAIPTTPADIQTVAALIEARTGMAAADVAAVLVPDFARRIGFPAHALTNNNNNIKRKQERLAEEEAKAARAADTGEDFTREVPVNGGVVSVRYNREMDRLQLAFPKGLIDSEALRGAALKWSPTRGVWQRQLTDNAVYYVNMMLSKAGATERLPTLAESLAARAPAAPATGSAAGELTAEDEAAADADAAALVAQAGLVEPGAEVSEEAPPGEAVDGATGAGQPETTRSPAAQSPDKAEAQRVLDKTQRRVIEGSTPRLRADNYGVRDAISLGWVQPDASTPGYVKITDDGIRAWMRENAESMAIFLYGADPKNGLTDEGVGAAAGWASLSVPGSPLYDNRLAEWNQKNTLPLSWVPAPWKNSPQQAFQWVLVELYGVRLPVLPLSHLRSKGGVNGVRTRADVVANYPEHLRGSVASALGVGAERETKGYAQATKKGAADREDPEPAQVSLTAADINMPPKSVYPRQELPFQTTDRLGIPYSLIRPYVGRRVVFHAPAARRFRGDFDEYGGLAAELLPPLGLDTWGDPVGVNPSVRLPAFGPSGRLITRSEDSLEVPAIEQDTNDPRMGFWSIVTLEPNKTQPTDVWVWRGLPPTYEAFAVGYYHGLVGKTPTPAYLQRVLGPDAEHTGGYGDGLHMGKQHRAAWIKAGRKPVPVKPQRDGA